MTGSERPETVAAVVCDAPEHAALGSVALAELADDDVLIATLTSGISTGTDKWVINGRFEWGGFGFPLVPGYQRIGIVVAVGRNVQSVKVNDRVFATSSKDFRDATAGWGAHAHWAISEQHEVFSAHDVSSLSGALTVSLQVGVNAASRISNPQGQRVLVIGDGIIGVSSALAAQERGCRILLAGHHDERLQLVHDVSNDIATVNTLGDWQQTLLEWEPTAVIDTVQNSDVISEYVPYLPCTWNTAASKSARSGVAEIVFAGHSPDGVTTWADMALLQKAEVTTHFVSGWTPERIELTLELLRTGRLDLDPFVTRSPATPGDITQLFRDVSAGSLSGISACIDWNTS
jgi:2-desacetyl-2-hydroxyethyl bacteriochlorophyllide A dehydrogenase